MNDPFLINLYTYGNVTSLEWTISFVNRACAKYVEHCPTEIFDLQLYFPESNVTKSYYANVNWWCAGIIEYCVPVLIANMIYLLKRNVVDTIKSLLHSGKKGKARSFANRIKHILYEKSNNICLLTIIQEIGFTFYHDFPGYCIELASSPELILFDQERFSHTFPNPTMDLLEKQMGTLVGIPDISLRYPICDCLKINLQTYFTYWQTTKEENVKLECYKILDSLYFRTPNTEENARVLLTIQSMDLRNAQVTDLDNGLLQYVPLFSGHAKKYAEAHDSTLNPSPEQKFLQDAAQLLLHQECNENDIDTLQNYADQIIQAMIVSTVPVQYHNPLIKIFSIVLQRNSLPMQKRNEYCELWVNGLRKIFLNDTFASELNTVDILFSQLKYDLAPDTARKVKRLMLDSILGIGSNGLINTLSEKVQNFLRNNPELANCVCATIIELAKDEMNHQKFNAEYLHQYHPEESISFRPNLQPKLLGVDHRISEDAGIGYCSKKEEIIEKYLFHSNDLDMDMVDSDYYDLQTLCLVANCGISLSNSSFRNLIHKIIVGIINIMQAVGKYKSHDIINHYALHQLVLLYRSQVIGQNLASFEAIDLLFDGIDFSKFTNDSIDFYCEILCSFAPAYFDAYNDPQKREQYTKCISYMEEKISNIAFEHIRKQLYKPLFFCVNPRSVGRWNKCKTKYTFQDKQFLNQQFYKYGKYFLKEVLITVYQFHIAELLPEILLSVRDCLSYNAENTEKLADIIHDEDVMFVINRIMLTAFLNFSEDIKAIEELTKAYEDILEILICLNYENAAVLLDEFRVH